MVIWHKRHTENVSQRNTKFYENCYTVENKYNGQQVQWTFEIGTENFFFGEKFLTTIKFLDH